MAALLSLWLEVEVVEPVGKGWPWVGSRGQVEGLHHQLADLMNGMYHDHVIELAHWWRVSQPHYTTYSLKFCCIIVVYMCMCIKRTGRMCVPYDILISFR